MSLDLVVIGLGSAGTAAATFAAGELGLDVVAIERDRIGGARAWTGCVPSKVLVASARVAHTVSNARRYGVTVDRPPRADPAAVWRRVREARDEIAAGDHDRDRLRSLGVEIVTGTARVTGAREVVVTTEDGERVLTSRFVLVCTGSRPATPDVPGLDDVPYLTTDQLFDLERPPASVVLIGGGPIGAELSQSLVRIGVPTTVFERAPRLVPRDEPELADRLSQALRDEGVEINLGRPVTEVATSSGGVIVTSSDARVEAEAVVTAAGRRSDVEELGLGRFGIVTGPDGVVVDGRSRTIVPSIYAVGDAAAGRARFTHAAVHDAVVAVRDMFFPIRGLAAGLVPWCTFTDPELAHVGLTAAQAREAHGSRAVTVHRHELSDNDRARADGHTAGAILVVTAKRRIVGAHVLAPAAGELIHELALAVRFGLDLDDLAGTVHISPTYASGIARLATAHANRRTHRYRALTRLSRWLG